MCAVMTCPTFSAAAFWKDVSSLKLKKLPAERDLDHWARAGRLPNVTRIKAADAYADRSLIKPGLVFILDFGGGHGHTGIVERVLDGGRLVSAEGNTNTDGSSNGVGVFRLERRKLNDADLKGFVDYTGA